MIRAFLFLLILFLVESCAREGSPTGGPKDEKAPFAYDSLMIPVNYTLNFKSKTIILPFNEYVSLIDPFRNILISPPLEEKPEIRTKGKNIVINLKENKLQPNTTYIINFGEAVEDLTEGNKALNLKYVFSTGPELDSLVVTGKVINAITLVPEEKVAVMLYKTLDDSLPYKTLPNYYALTDKQGNFEITHVHEGIYKVFGLKDQNFSLTYDLQTEQIAFTDSLVVPTTANSDSLPLDLRLFLEDYEKQYLVKYALKYPGFLSVILNKPTKNPNLIPLDKAPPIFHEEYSKNKDTLTYWFGDLSAVDSFQYAIADGDTIIDTMVVESTRDLKKTKTKDTLTFSSNSKANFDLFDTLKFTFSQPLSKIDSALITLTKDSLPEAYNYTIGGKSNKTLKVWCNWEQQSVYEVLLLPKTITTLYNLYNDTISTNFKTQEKSFYGKLIVDIVLDSTLHHPYILELIDEGGKLITEKIINSSQKISFPDLLPKKYTLKLLYDLNGNGRWDPGRYLKHIPSERIIYFNEEITIQSGWDSEIQWITDKKLTNNTTQPDSLSNDTLPKK